MNKKELLIPVGNHDALIAAINNGADAVYLAGKKFGARAFANNFTLEELKDVIYTCHLYGVKVYITVNTLVYEDEIEESLEFIKAIHEYGVDALIMQDIGLINIVHNMYPNLEIHASTQMHNHSKDNMKFLEDLGIKRVVFARELSLDEMDSIDTPLEKEAFIHGSLCVSYSGQCYFSKEVLDRSANRGECAGMCRLPYELYENDKKIKTNGDYLLSPKDLCTIDEFKKIMESSIYSLKIEGRMKSALYVGTVTRIYRKLIDDYYEGKELFISKEDEDLLKAIFYREYTKGFILNDSNIMNHKSSNHIGLFVGKVIGITDKKIKIKLDRDIYQGEGIRFRESDKGITLNFIYDEKDNLINKGTKGNIIYLDNFFKLKSLDTIYLTNPLEEENDKITKKVSINAVFKASLNKKISFEVDDGINKVIVEGNTAEMAKNSPITKEDISKFINKLGDTPYKIENFNILLEDNLFIRINDLNNLRRDAVDKLNEKRTSIKEVIVHDLKDEQINKEKCSSLMVLARTKEQVDTLKELGVQIAVDNPLLMEDEIYFRPPRNKFIYDYNFKNYLVSSYASMMKYPNNYSDLYLNVTNHYSLSLLLKYNNVVTLSMENTIEDIKKIVDKSNNKNNIAVYIYGNSELMMMKACLLKNVIGKDKCSVCFSKNEYLLKDRNNAMYKIITDPLSHTSYILSYKKLIYLID